MDGNSVTGLNGFLGKLFTFAWEVIAQEVFNAVVSFFFGAKLSQFITSTTIVFFLQCRILSTKFHPISLCNFLNKVISRILVDRLSPLLPLIISSQQSGFMKGRNMTYNYLVAQELISDNGKKCKGSVTLKLDMAKVYDRMSCSFLSMCCIDLDLERGLLT